MGSITKPFGKKKNWNSPTLIAKINFPIRFSRHLFPSPFEPLHKYNLRRTAYPYMRATHTRTEHALQFILNNLRDHTFPKSNLEHRGGHFLHAPKAAKWQIVYSWPSYLPHPSSRSFTVLVSFEVYRYSFIKQWVNFFLHIPSPSNSIIFNLWFSDY